MKTMKVLMIITLLLLTTMSLSGAAKKEDNVVVSSYDDSILGDGTSRLGLDTVIGDVNGDGIDDIIMSQTEDPAKYQTINNIVNYDYSVYIVYGNPNKITQDLLQEKPDLIIHHLTPYDSKLGHALAIGDVNGDGIDDMLIGAMKAPTANGGAQAGIFYVVYGSYYPIKTIIDFNNVNPDLTILGNGNPKSLGNSAASGDFNGDGIDDIIVGASLFGSRGAPPTKVYVFYGKSWSAGAVIDMSNTNADLTIMTGINSDDFGASMTSVDMDNDGFDEIIISADTAKNPTTGNQTGAVYIVYGKNYEPNTLIDTSQSQEVTKIYGVRNSDHFGSVVSTGYIDDDEKQDVIIGAGAATINDNMPFSGATYVLYGKNIYKNSLIDLSDIQANLTIIGDEEFGNFGSSISTGRINNDDLDDIVIGKYEPGIMEQGKAFVIYGKKHYQPNIIDLSSDNADVTFIPPILGMGNGFADRVNAGDIDDDGFDDIIISSWLANVRENVTITGAVYIYRGKNLVTFNPAGRALPAQAQKPKTFNIVNALANFISGFFVFGFKK